MRVLYIVYWGAMEQLGRSLVIPQVSKLAENGVEMTLVTFEKPQDLQDRAEVKRVEARFKSAGVEWKPLKYHKEPKLPAMAFDVFQGIATSLIKRLGSRFDIIHARTFQAGLIGYFASMITRAKFVYHNEGYYPDEQVDAGVWALDSKPHRYARKLEALMYRKSAAVIGLSETSATEIRELNPKVAVVPSCVDLEKFELQPRSASEVFRFVYLGSVGGRYDFKRIAGFISALVESSEKVELQVFSRADIGLIETEIAGTGLKSSDIEIESLTYDQVPERLGKHDAGIHFLKPGIAEHAGSPTKIGEYWAVGLPVVMTPAMGDTGNIAEAMDVGVVLNENSDFEGVFSRLRKIVSLPDHRERCREAAIQHYGIESAVETQLGLYKELL